MLGHFIVALVHGIECVAIGSRQRTESFVVIYRRMLGCLLSSFIAATWLQHNNNIALSDMLSFQHLIVVTRLAAINV